MEWAHLFFLMVLMFHSCADAQAGTISNPPLGFTLRDNLKATMSVMLVAFLFAFLFMGFFSLYLGYCSYGYNTNRNPITAAKDLCLRGFNRQLIDKCPVLVYSTIKNLKIGKATLECAVCLSEFDDSDKIRLLPKCHHVFHPDCIDNWLLSHMNCPVCRTKLTVDVPDINIASNGQENTITITELTDQNQGMENENEDGQSRTVMAEVDTVINIPSRETRMLEKFPRSHSTGHSLTEIEENVKVVDRYTLRLPEHVSKHILASNAEIPRLETSDVVLPAAWSSKRTCYRSSNNVERWSLMYMTPPPRWGLLRNETTCWTPLRMPFYKVQGTQKPSPV